MGVNSELPIRKQVGRQRPDVDPLQKMWRMREMMRELLGDKFYNPRRHANVRKLVGRVK